MKRILINATHNEEIRVALCKDNHLYDFDLENRTREQKKANIYKGHVTRVEPSLEAVFVEYGSARQGFLPLREIAPEYLKGNPRNDNIRELIKEGDEVIIQIEKEERGNKGAAVSTFISLAGRYLVLMPNNQKAGGISRQISGKVREEMKQIISSLSIPQGMSVIVRTAGIGKGFEDLQNDLNHLLTIWSSILEQNRTRPSPCLVHQEAGVVTRAVRDYLRDDIGEVWIDSENAYNEAANFIASVMPNQMGKLRKYTDYEPLFVRFGIERQIESAYQREVRLPSGGSIVIDQTEAMVAIDINSAKSTKGSDVAETAYHTNLEAAEEIARQLRLRDMGGLIVIDFIDMADPAHQKDVEKRLIDATRYDRARVQFAEISKFGLMEMSRQRLRPSLEEATGYLCPRCHGNGMIRDLRSLALSIMRQIEQIALKERFGEIQAEVPTEIAAFLLNEKRESLVYLEQDSGVRVTILPHAHLESPNFSLHFNPDGFAPASYERIVDMEERENVERGYEVNWQTKHDEPNTIANRWQGADNANKLKEPKTSGTNKENSQTPIQEIKAVAWLSNLFAPKPQARLARNLSNEDAAAAIESIVNSGASSLGVFGQINPPKSTESTPEKVTEKTNKVDRSSRMERDDKNKKKPKPTDDNKSKTDGHEVQKGAPTNKDKIDKADRRKKEQDHSKREPNSQRESRGEVVRGETLTPTEKPSKQENGTEPKTERKAQPKTMELTSSTADTKKVDKTKKVNTTHKPTNINDVVIHTTLISEPKMDVQNVHLSLDNSKPIKKKTVPPTELVVQDVPPTLSNDAVVVASSENMVESLTDDANTQQVHNTNTTQKPTDNISATAINNNHIDNEMPHTIVDARHLNVLATQMNKVVNDPRVVAIALREQFGLAATPLAATSPTIKGTAGEFICTTLGDSLSENWRDEFVSTFILAMDVATKTSANPPQKTSNTTIISDDEFEYKFAKWFGNYGYAPLSADYLADFANATTTYDEYHIDQGKTTVAPNPIGERATNDPRGQHSNFSETTSPKMESNPKIDPIPDMKPTSTTESTTKPSKLKAEPSKVDPSLDTPNTASAKPKQLSSNTNETQQTTSNHTQNTGGEQTETSRPETTLSVDGTVDKMLESAESALESLVQTLGEIIQPSDSHNASDNNTSKSTPVSYKDMIESVSGQLLQPTGILNLVAPKKPKTTKTKPPKPPKAPTKRTSKAAQKAEVVKRTTKEETVTSDTPSVPLDSVK